MSEVIPFITTQERIRNLCTECPRHSGSLLLPVSTLSIHTVRFGKLYLVVILRSTLPLLP